jgi:hypothetical protein
MTTHRVSPGTMPRGDCLLPMTDAEYAKKIDNSPPIGAAYANLGRIGNPTLAACAYAGVYWGRRRGNQPTDKERVFAAK